MTLVHEPPADTAVHTAPCTDPALGGAALDALDSGATPDADVVAWISEHLTALEQVVYPAARRALPDRRELHAQRARAHDLEHALRRLHQRVSGDGVAMHLPVTRVRDEVRALLCAHTAAERRLEAQLQAALPSAGWDELAARYRRAVEVAPTRPHPHAPHSGWTGRFAHSLLAQVDRLLDGLDARPVHDPPR
jgi:hypothetical protein